MKNRFKTDHVPHLVPNFESVETVTIFKGSSCGATECISDISYTWENSKKRNVKYSMDHIISNSVQCGFSMEKFEMLLRKYEAVENYMKDLKSKYPDYIFGNLFKSKKLGIIILDEAVDINEIEPLESIVGVKRASEIRKKMLLPILKNRGE